ncbi:MAG TPA: DNA-directed RNA polymerase subunit P [archaeon]|nr:DNA-directed RNA polymerase subunit P [archaeon]
MYMCIKCGKTVPEVSGSSIRCPSCGFKIFSKLRDPVTKTVKSE